MFPTFRTRFGAPGVIAFIALVLAMVGGAFAADHSGSGATASKTKIGPRGPRGKTGPVGPQGLAGSTGAKGDTGATGSQGPAGPAGKDGTTGFTKTLPAGETEMGAWAIEAQNVTAPNNFQEGSASTAISFNIPLASAPEPIYVEESEAAPPGCAGNVEEPGAEEGHLCVFAAFEHNNNSKPHICSAAKSLFTCLFGGVPGVEGTADPSGAYLGVVAEAAGLVALNGTWAVTAE